MFDFWKEVVINAAKVDGRDRVEVKDGLLRVLRCADYKLDGIVGGIHVTEPTEASYGKVVLGEAAAAEGYVYQLTLKIALHGKADSEYALPWTSGKPVILEGADADAILAKAEGIRGIAVNEGAIECVDGHMIISKAKLAKIGLASGEVVTETDLLATEEARVLAAGKPAVGTGEWLTENLRFPTNANRNYVAVHADETPVLGANYVQYAFEYVQPNRGLHGQGTVGQEMTSVTHHVFYVREDLDTVIDAFNAAIEALKPTAEPTADSTIEE